MNKNKDITYPNLGHSVKQCIEIYFLLLMTTLRKKKKRSQIELPVKMEV